jgi:PPOX class probable F420-dependent enzyme
MTFRKPSKEEVHIVSGTLTGNISTVRKDGRPHVAIWFTLDKDSDINVIFTTDQDSVKAKHMLRNSRVSFCVDDQAPPFSFVIIDRTVEINQEPDLNELLKRTTKIAGRYMGHANAEA